MALFRERERVLMTSPVASTTVALMTTSLFICGHRAVHLSANSFAKGRHPVFTDSSVADGMRARTSAGDHFRVVEGISGVTGSQVASV